jgi:hypothetical protein
LSTSPLDTSKLHYKQVEMADGTRFIVLKDCMFESALKAGIEQVLEKRRTYHRRMELAKTRKQKE